MNKEEILLEALNTFGNFTTVSQEFNENQLEAIYEAMELVKNNAVLPLVSPCYDRDDMQEAFNAGGIGESWENWIKEYDSPI